MVKDTEVNEHNGTFVDWHLKLWGESIDASKQALLPMPTEHDDDDHDQIATTTIAGTTTSLIPAATASSPPGNPTDHPDRPVNEKPSGTTLPSVTGTPTSAAPETTTSAPPKSWLPSFFPTFNVSAKTQIWIYGAATLILLFCLSLGLYFYLARRRRLRNNPRDEWEFDLLEEDEADGLNGGPRSLSNGGKKGKGGKRRAGELYDAFAAGSEDESEGAGEYADESEGEVDEGGEREKRLYEDEEEAHVIGDESEEEGDEKVGREGKEGLLRK